MAEDYTPPRDWQLKMGWPIRLEALPSSAASAIETAALAIRMVSSHLKDPDMGLAEADKNPLLNFALRFDDMSNPEGFSAPEQQALLKWVCDAFGLAERELSFQALMRSDLMNKTFWDNPALDIFTIYNRYGENPWTRAVTEGSSGEASIVHWDGLSSLAATVRRQFGPSTYQGFDYFLAFAVPRVIRVEYEPSRQRRYEEIRRIKVEALSLEVDGNNSRPVEYVAEYVLVGAIRHRVGEQTELVRFYNAGEQYIKPSLPGGKYVARPYVSDNWRIGSTASTYTLLYAHSSRPASAAACEFIPESVLQNEAEDAESFEGCLSFPDVGEGDLGASAAGGTRETEGAGGN